MARALSLVLIGAAALAGAALAAGCGDDEPESDSGAGGLVFTRADGSTFSIADARVLCQPTDTQAEGNRQSILVVGPQEVFETEGELTEPYFSLEAVVDDVASPGTMVRFPDEVYGDGSGVSLFAADPDGLETLPGQDVEGGDTASNELSSSEEEARGEIVFEKVSCSPPEISFRVDARLGSEFFEQPSVTVDGAFHGRAEP